VTAHEQSRARTVLLGTEGPFSSAVFRGLLHAGANVVGVVVDGDHHHHANSIITLSAHGHGETLPSLAASQGVPLRTSRDVADPGLTSWVDDLAPDFIVVACFEQILSEAFCALARRDCLNIHPSLLPRYRGPTPLFWQLRAGEQATGVTLHRVTPEIDAGPIVDQQPVSLDDGLDGAAINERLAVAGARLFIDTLANCRTGALAVRDQDAAHSSYQRSPSVDDFRVASDWSARQLFNFIRGTGHWGHGYPIEIDGRQFLLREAVAFMADDSQSAPYEIFDDEIRIRCKPGILHAKVGSGLR